MDKHFIITQNKCMHTAEYFHMYYNVKKTINKQKHLGSSEGGCDGCNCTPLLEASTFFPLFLHPLSEKLCMGLMNTLTDTQYNVTNT